ncbi:MAG: efflux RND transporter periplasmic adaptor subunit [Sedimentisphaerales bacterium]|nr:efflux RND transporter periplasmic adaptor subunit [Sedimentisphaerales bacterium]
MKKWLIFTVILLGLGTAVVNRIYKLHTTQSAESIDKIQEKEGIPVKVFETEVRDLKKTISLSGSIEPCQQISISPTLTERIMEIPVTTGQLVEPGDLLVILEDTTSKLRLANAQAGLDQARQQLTRLENGSRPEEIDAARAMMEQARAAFELQEIEVKRQQQLYDEEATTLKQLQDTQSGYSTARAALDAATAQYELIKKGPRQEDIEIARTQVTLAQLALDRAQKDLNDHYLRAPFSGVVTLKILEPGDVVEMNKPIFQLCNISKVYLDLNISELYIPHVSVGMTVEIRVDSLGDTAFSGTVAEINPLANQTDRSYRTRIIIDNEKGLILPGMFARAQIITGQIRQAMVVPLDAVHSEGDHNYVLILDHQLIVQRRDVTVGKTYQDTIHIVEGLSPGDKVITLSYQVKPGDKVIIL